MIISSSQQKPGPVLPVRLGSLDNLERTLHKAATARIPFDALAGNDRKRLRRQAEAVRRLIINLNSTDEKRPPGDPASVTGHVDRMAEIAARRKDDAGPTPGLLAKRQVPRKDVLEKLAANGRLREVHLWAADEIRRIWLALDRNIVTNASSYGEVRVDRSRRISTPTDRFSSSEALAYENRYRIWAGEAAKASVRRRETKPGRPRKGHTADKVSAQKVLPVVLRVVCENQPPTRVERDLGLPVGRSVVPVLAHWLYRYAEIAGWVE